METKSLSSINSGQESKVLFCHMKTNGTGTVLNTVLSTATTHMLTYMQAKHGISVRIVTQHTMPSGLLDWSKPAKIQIAMGLLLASS